MVLPDEQDFQLNFVSDLDAAKLQYELTCGGAGDDINADWSLTGAGEMWLRQVRWRPSDPPTDAGVPSDPPPDAGVPSDPPPDARVFRSV
eukprot:8843533-Pyramimonas_sp.AAC.1